MAINAATPFTSDVMLGAYAVYGINTRRWELLHQSRGEGKKNFARVILAGTQFGNSEKDPGTNSLREER